MALTFYYLSGSPFSWKVWLALEHKELPYVMKVLSADAGDLGSPEFVAVNPRGKVPAIIDGEFVLNESAAIIDYLEDHYRNAGSALWPSDTRAKATARRVAIEGDGYIYPHVRRLVVELVMRKDGTPDRTAVDEARDALARELPRLDRDIQGPFITGDEPSAADFANYPFLAILNRVSSRRPEFGLSAVVPDGLRPWMAAVEGLSYFAKTIPPHWRTA